jgi:hypothetical protein
MYGLQSRALVLTGLFLLATGVLRVLATSDASPAARWPMGDAMFQVDGWTVSSAKPEIINGVQFVSWTYQNASGNTTATLTLSTSPEAKRIYRAGPEVPFLGNGFTVQPMPALAQPRGAVQGALVGTRGDESWLQLTAYGEHRGALGNGPLAWGLTVFDTALGQRNDYYLARLLVPVSASGTDPAVAGAAQTLADVVFARLASWYAA